MKPVAIKPTDYQLEKLIAKLSIGIHPNVACAAVGIRPSVFKALLAEAVNDDADPQIVAFAQQISTTMAEVQESILNQLWGMAFTDDIEGDFRALKLLSEMIMPEYHIKEPQVAVQINNDQRPQVLYTPEPKEVAEILISASANRAEPVTS